MNKMKLFKNSWKRRLKIVRARGGCRAPGVQGPLNQLSENELTETEAVGKRFTLVCPSSSAYIL